MQYLAGWTPLSLSIHSLDRGEFTESPLTLLRGYTQIPCHRILSEPSGAARFFFALTVDGAH